MHEAGNGTTLDLPSAQAGSHNAAMKTFDEPYDVLLHFSSFGVPTIVEPRSPSCPRGRHYIAVDLEVLETNAHVPAPDLSAAVDPALAEAMAEAKAALARYLARLDELAGRSRNS